MYEVSRKHILNLEKIRLNFRKQLFEIADCFDGIRLWNYYQSDLLPLSLKFQ